MRFQVQVHIPHGSGDGEYHIIDTSSGAVIAIVDPNNDHTDGQQLACDIADAMNTYQVMGG